MVAFAMLLGSCEKEKNDVIPDVYVSFTIDLNDPEFTSLTSLFGSAYVNSNTNNWGTRAAGYNSNGIIVFTGADEFYAYDRTCPHDYVENDISVKVNIDFIQAICPSCSTHYSLSTGGNPISGPGRYPLKNYKTSYSGNYVTVWNY